MRYMVTVSAMLAAACLLLAPKDAEGVTLILLFAIICMRLWRVHAVETVDIADGDSGGQVHGAGLSGGSDLARELS